MLVLDIGEVAERSGVPPSTLRYYEQIGLIASRGRHGLRRQFDADVLLTLSLVGMGKAAGFSLAEIAAVLGQGGSPELPRDRLRARAGELQKQILELQMLRDVLRHVANCPAPTHLECPTFRKLMQVGPRRGLVYHPSRERAKRAGKTAGRR